MYHVVHDEIYHVENTGIASGTQAATYDMKPDVINTPVSNHRPDPVIVDESK